ncbi:LysM peptidoglycan-binding domain-containing protein [Acinetobacter guerrae]|uniref:LysM peptidoglycan-binding domain-containing protein n=1 Tax=Acinetobacter guerrae TaxID=1843371 RepID=A0A3A8E7W3_9GAMM|nr:LysM peptidoglycan-binding domain-containing protein [Acinetobacter guerrae]RKG31122.1 LysM peptidoglycan-binding domain-containing protein [Acinetobacter guerrae]
MKKVLYGIRSFNALGFKKQCIAVAICAGLGMTGLSVTYAASPNVNPPALRASAPHVYVVKKGDTLWDISGKFLDKPWRWPEIWASNKHVKNPHWIYPGDRLLLCTLDGRPLVGRDEGDGCEGIIRRYSGRTTLQPQVRIEQLSNSIPVIPLDNIKQWLDRTAIVASDSIENTPYILGTADQRVLAGKGQSVYVRGQGLTSGQRYAVYRKGEPYVLTDAKGKKHTVGLELLQVASGIVTQTDHDIATMELTDSYNAEVRRGDLVMFEQEAMLPTLFYPTEANQVTQGGQIIRVMGSIGSAAKNSVVTIDRGRLDGVQSGHIFAIYQQGETVQDPKTKEKIKLPNQKVGTLMVFRTFDQLSYAYVLESSLPIKVGAEILPPRLDD